MVLLLVLYKNCQIPRARPAERATLIRTLPNSIDRNCRAWPMFSLSRRSYKYLMDATGPCQSSMRTPDGRKSLRGNWMGGWDDRSASREWKKSVLGSFAVLCLDLDQATVSFTPAFHRLLQSAKIGAVVPQERVFNLSRFLHLTYPVPICLQQSNTKLREPAKRRSKRRKKLPRRPALTQVTKRCQYQGRGTSKNGGCKGEETEVDDGELG